MAEKKNRLQTLDRGILVLKLVGHHPSGLSMADIATHMSIDRAIAYRIIATLEDHALVTRLDNGNIVLGTGVLTMASQFDANLRAHAKPLLEMLSIEVNATAFISMAEGNESVAIMVIEAQQSFLKLGYRLGSRHPLTVGAAGLAILAGRKEKPQDAEDVKRARRDGYCITRGQIQSGAIGVASPICLSTELYPTLECAIGIVSMEGLDLENAKISVMDFAGRLRELMHG